MVFGAKFGGIAGGDALQAAFKIAAELADLLALVVAEAVLHVALQLDDIVNDARIIYVVQRHLVLPPLSEYLAPEDNIVPETRGHGKGIGRCHRSWRLHSRRMGSGRGIN